MSLKQRYRSSLGFLLLIFTVISPCLSQAGSYKCISNYVEARSVHFGVLLRQAKTLEELEFLNEISIHQLQFSAEPQPEEHMINSLIFYKRSYELHLKSILTKDLYHYILNNSESVLKTSSKFQFFKSYLKPNLS